MTTRSKSATSELNTNNSTARKHNVPSVHPMVTRSNNVTNQQVNITIQKWDNEEPKTFKEASTSTHWNKAMIEEYNALISQNTWDLVHPVPNIPIVGCKWTYRIKRNTDGSISRYKARLVAKGF